jgi:hypothetical protein
MALMQVNWCSNKYAGICVAPFTRGLKLSGSQEFLAGHHNVVVSHLDPFLVVFPVTTHPMQIRLTGSIRAYIADYGGMSTVYLLARGINLETILSCSGLLYLPATSD